MCAAHAYVDWLAEHDFAKVIEAVIRERFVDAGIEAVRVNKETDYDGDAIFRVTVVFNPKDNHPLDAHKTASITRHIRHKLLEEHEEAFPILAFVSKADAVGAGSAAA
jgi:hypothetical protein